MKVYYWRRYVHFRYFHNRKAWYKVINTYDRVCEQEMRLKYINLPITGKDMYDLEDI